MPNDIHCQFLFSGLRKVIVNRGTFHLLVIVIPIKIIFWVLVGIEMVMARGESSRSRAFRRVLICRYTKLLLILLTWISCNGIQGAIIRDDTGFLLDGSAGIEVCSVHENMTFNEIMQTPKMFKKVQIGSDQWFDQNMSSHWIKVRLMPSVGDEDFFVRENIISNIWEEVSLYSTCQSEHQIAGLGVPLQKRSVQKGMLLFELPKCARSFDLYIQLKSYFNTPMAKAEFRIQNKKALENWLSYHYYLQGIYFGIVLIMAIFNLFLFISLKDKSFLYYVLFIVTFGLLWTSFFTTGSEFYWPNAPKWNVVSTFYLTVISSFFAILFVMSYLGTKENLPTIHILLKVIAAVYLVLVLIGLTGFNPLAQNLAAFSAIITILIIQWGAVLLMRRGYRPAYYLFFAWLIMTIFGILYSLAFMGFVPLNLFVTYGLELGSAIEAGLLSFGLAHRYNLMHNEKELIKKEHMEAHHRLEILKTRNEVMTNELQMARKIQENLMMDNFSIQNIAALYLPMENLGGDFFEIIELDVDKTAIFLADVSGHGVPAALITAMIKSVISNEAAKIKKDQKGSWLKSPREMLLHLNSVFSMEVHNSFLSALYAIYDKKSRIMIMAAAAHPPPILFSSNSNENSGFLEMPKQGPPAGIYRNSELKKEHYSEKEFQLDDGDKILFYSDGMTDAFNYTYKDLDKGIDSFHETPLYKVFKDLQKNSIHASIEEFRKLYPESNRNDDICLVLMEV